MKRTTNLEKKATAKSSSGCRFLASGVDLCFESKPVWALRWALAPCKVDSWTKSGP